MLTPPPTPFCGCGTPESTSSSLIARRRAQRVAEEQAAEGSPSESSRSSIVSDLSWISNGWTSSGSDASDWSSLAPCAGLSSSDGSGPRIRPHSDSPPSTPPPGGQCEEANSDSSSSSGESLFSPHSYLSPVIETEPRNPFVGPRRTTTTPLTLALMRVRPDTTANIKEPLFGLQSPPPTITPTPRLMPQRSPQRPSITPLNIGEQNGRERVRSRQEMAEERIARYFAANVHDPQRMAQIAMAILEQQEQGEQNREDRMEEDGKEDGVEEEDMEEVEDDMDR